MRKLKGFTLTELMIALAVIGILVAVVTPTIMKTRPNKNKMMIKKTYYQTEQIVSSLINDEQLYPDKRENCYLPESAGELTYCAWGFDDDSEVNYEGETYSGDDKFAKLFISKLNVKSVDPDDEYIVTTTDGVKWGLTPAVDAWTKNKSKVGTFASQGSDTAGLGQIIIDVDGGEPDCLQATDSNCEEPDQYIIQILANGKMRVDPRDVKASEYITIQTSIKDNIK